MVSRSLFRFEQTVVEIFRLLYIRRANGFRVSWMIGRTWFVTVCFGSSRR